MKHSLLKISEKIFSEILSSMATMPCCCLTKAVIICDITYKAFLFKENVIYFPLKEPLKHSSFIDLFLY